jgi:hypothetical protein
MNTNLDFYGFSNSIAFCEAQGLANCFQAYADECAGTDIMSVGFNPNSGYVYIALENGVQICSMLGRGVEFLVTNFESGEEIFFDSYGEAMNYEQAENWQ